VPYFPMLSTYAKDTVNTGFTEEKAGGVIKIFSG
jgi:hypothetical protein